MPSLFFRFGFAPAFSRVSTVDLWPLAEANRRAVFNSLFWKSLFAPAESNTETASVLPFAAAISSGVSPLSFKMFGSSPALSSCLTFETLLSCEAWCSLYDEHPDVVAMVNKKPNKSLLKNKKLNKKNK